MKEKNTKRIHNRIYSINVIARPRKDYSNLKESVARHRFWRYYCGKDKLDIEECEGRFESSFGLHLKTMFSKHFYESWYGNNHRIEYIEGVEKDSYPAGKLLSQVGFKARIKGYSSLDFSLEIAGAENLAKLLGGNFDLFMILLEAYLPSAFDSIQNYEYDKNPLLFETTATEDLIELFANEAGVQKTKTSVSRKANWVWIVNNFSLLFPVLLALLVCYAALKYTYSIDESLQASLKEVRKSEQLLLERSMRRVSELESKLLDHINSEVVDSNNSDNNKPNETKKKDK